MAAIYHIDEDKEVPYEDTYNAITPECNDFIKECFVRDPTKSTTTSPFDL